MTCSKCGTVIADHALVCYRCGTPTAVPAAPAPAASRRGRPVVSALALVVLVVSALYLGMAPGGAIPRAVSWSVAALGLVVVVWWLAARGRRRD